MAGGRQIGERRWLVNWTLSLQAGLMRAHEQAALSHVCLSILSLITYAVFLEAASHSLALCAGTCHSSHNDTLQLVRLTDLVQEQPVDEAMHMQPLVMDMLRAMAKAVESPQVFVQTHSKRYLKRSTRIAVGWPATLWSGLSSWSLGNSSCQEMKWSACMDS